MKEYNEDISMKFRIYFLDDIILQIDKILIASTRTKTI